MENISQTDIQSLKEKLNRAKRDLAVLYDISNAMRTTLELNHILHIILTGVTAHTGLGFNRAILFLVNEDAFCLEPKMAIGPESGEHAMKIWKYISESNQHLEDLIEQGRMAQNTNRSSLYNSIKHIKISLDGEHNNLLASAYHHGTPMHIKKDEIQQYANDPILQVLNTHELVIMPLKAKDKVKGLIIADNLYTKKSITEDDLRMFMMLANQAGLAIENSQLYEMVKYKSHTDSITNLWNHGFFQNQLSIEIDKAKHENIPLSLIILDIDNFKKLNDTYGHQNGDIVLKEIAKILKDSSRDIDYVCRYGGEEFSIILPRTDKPNAYTIAERIRQRIEQHNFPKFSLFKKTKLTVSVGVATFPEDAQNKEELINAADKAMYKAKFGGKNQTLLA